LLGWDDLATLRKSGFTLGAHTRTHPNLPTLDEGELLEEVCVAADEMERRLGERPRGFAYPYGAVDARVADVTARCYKWACTTSFRSLGAEESLNMLPRLDAWYFRQPERLERWGTAGFRASLWCRRQARRARVVMHRMGSASA
jgi:peptidoglycan/xylan/chitin deacetylase (PgdA/CDA1 family)